MAAADGPDDVHPNIKEKKSYASLKAYRSSPMTICFRTAAIAKHRFFVGEQRNFVCDAVLPDNKVKYVPKI